MNKNIYNINIFQSIHRAGNGCIHAVLDFGESRDGGGDGVGCCHVQLPLALHCWANIAEINPKIQQEDIPPFPFSPPSWNSGERRGAYDNGLTFPTDPSRRLCPPRCPGWQVPIHKSTTGLETKETLKNDSFSL